MDVLRPPRIETYALFGEQGDLPDVVHVETIEARSRLHNWEFAPHRHGRLHQILWLEAGEGRAALEGRGVPLPAGTLVNLPVGCVHGFTFVRGTSGLVVTLAAETVDAVLTPREGLAQVLARPAARPARADAAAAMRQMAEAFAGRAFARAQVLRGLAAVLLGQIAQILAEDTSAEGVPGPPPLLARFEALLDAHFAEHWPVAAYAKALAVTPTHLSRVSRAATGQPASRLIEERLLREARRNLVYTNLSVQTIAYTLGYSDPAYFSRVFARGTGLSPRAFRAEVLAEGDQRAQ